MRVANLLAAIAVLVPLATFGATVNVAVTNFAFTPSSVTIAPGDSVQWNFSSTHTSTSDTTSAEVWNSGVLSSGSFTHTFNSAGTFTYHCALHPFMTGSVHVAASAPALASITPATGPAAGGTSVTLTGTNFTTGCTVDFGGIGASNVAVPNATTITAMTPAHAAGAVNVDVACTGGTATLTNGFTFSAGPAAAVPLISGRMLALLAAILAAAGAWMLRR